MSRGELGWSLCERSSAAGRQRRRVRAVEGGGAERAVEGAGQNARLRGRGRTRAGSVGLGG